MREAYYRYIKVVGIVGIVLISLLYLFFYFYPALNKINSIKKELKEKERLLNGYEVKIMKFEPPDAEEKALWMRVEEKIKNREKIIKTKKEVFEFMVNSSSMFLNDLSEVGVDCGAIKVSFKEISIIKYLRKRHRLIKSIMSLLEGSVKEVERKSVISVIPMMQRTEENSANSSRVMSIKYKFVIYSKIRNAMKFLRDFAFDFEPFLIKSFGVYKNGENMFYVILVEYRFKGYIDAEE